MKYRYSLTNRKTGTFAEFVTLTQALEYLKRCDEPDAWLFRYNDKYFTNSKGSAEQRIKELTEWLHVDYNADLIQTIKETIATAGKIARYVNNADN